MKVAATTADTSNLPEAQHPTAPLRLCRASTEANFQTRTFSFARLRYQSDALAKVWIFQLCNLNC